MLVDRELRTIVTRDVQTMIGYHDAVLATGISTPGVIVLKRDNEYKVLAEHLTYFATCATSTDIHSHCVFLPL